jgi:hypothetical protein
LAATPPLDLSTQPTDEALATLLWERAPELQDARARVAAALAETRKTRRLPNPELDVGLNTLPLGALNPDCVADSACASAPWLNIPNLQVGLSVLLEIGKREPRQEAAAWAVRAAALEALEALRQRVLTLHDVLGDVAAAQVRDGWRNSRPRARRRATPRTSTPTAPASSRRAAPRPSGRPRSSSRRRCARAPSSSRPRACPSTAPPRRRTGWSGAFPTAATTSPSAQT